jgi:hypothetical protein
MSLTGAHGIALGTAEIKRFLVQYAYGNARFYRRNVKLWGRRGCASAISGDHQVINCVVEFCPNVTANQSIGSINQGPTIRLG